MRKRFGGSASRGPCRLVAAILALALVAVGLFACGGDDDDEEITLDKEIVSKNLTESQYQVADAEPGSSSLPSLVDVDFATGPDSGFTNAIQVGGNGLEPFSPDDVSKTGFVLFYEDADKAADVDDKLGSGEGQQRKGNALFIYGNGVDSPPEAFNEMIGAAEGN